MVLLPTDFIDQYFKENHGRLGELPSFGNDMIIYVNTKQEPTTRSINSLMSEFFDGRKSNPFAIVGIGGGITLENIMNDVSMLAMIKSGVYFGHRKRFGCPAFGPYIYGIREGAHIINLEKTLPLFEEALSFASYI